MNGGVTDIRKRTIQRFCRRLGLNSLLANRRQSPDQLVIVKTNLNYGGEKEDVLSKEEKTELGLPLGKPVIESAMDYKVMALSEVDEALWTDERLTIEKYVTNSEDKIFRFYVMKRSVVLTEAINPRLIKKMVPGLTRREYFLRLLERGFRPGAIRDRRLNKLLIDAAAFIIGFQLDFGTVEAVMSDEADPYIIDVTTTPYWGKESRTEVLDFLRTGIG